LDINEYYRGIIDSDFEKNVESAQEQQKYILSSTAKSHGIYVHTLYMPKIFTKEMADYFKSISATMYKILKKVITEYEKNPEYRKLFGFDKRLEELILRPDRYKCKLPIARIDIFFNEDDFSFKFCEFNADGASAMNEDRELNIALSQTHAFKKFSKRYRTKTYNLFDSWVKEFMKIYNTSPEKKDNPHIAIVDFIHGHPETEFEQFKQTFINQGYSCEICNITDLKYENGALLSASGKQIDVIYRRAVTCDIMEKYDDVQPFINAVKDNAVCIIGDFKTQVIHNKVVFKVLHNKMTRTFLTDEEIDFVEEHIPYTVSLTKENCRINNVLKNKNAWVIKPEDSYASKGVYAGVEFDNDADWKKAVLQNIDNSYLLQEYCTPYETTNIDLLYDKNAEYKKYSNITGLFLYNGKFSGIYTRIAKNSIISTQYSEMSLPSIVVSEKSKKS
jgi:rRNA processing protein Krr1/Pno1